MAIKDYAIPNEVSYVKLKDYPNGEKINIVGCGIKREAKYGPMPYLISDDGQSIAIPSRYVDLIDAWMNDTEVMDELKKGVVIEKETRETQNGGETPIFTIA